MSRRLRWFFLFGFFVGSQLGAWQPTGWVYQNGDFLFAHESQHWYYKQPSWVNWVVHLDNGVWQKTAVNGWCYYAWPYFFSSQDGQWYFTADPGSGAHVVNLYLKKWSIFGEVAATADDFSAIPAPGTEKWWSYETSGQISASFDGTRLTLFPRNSIRVFHDGSTGVRTMRWGGALSGFSEGYSVSGDFDFMLTEAMSRRAGKLVIDGGRFDLAMNLTVDGTNAIGSVSGNYDYNPILQASSSPLLRDDLWDLPVGHTKRTSTTISMHGEIFVSVPGEGSETEPFSDSETGYEEWQVVSKHTRYSVNGRTFRNVVKVRSTTFFPSLENEALEETQTDIWLAEGIGLIEAENYFQLYDRSVDLKIIDSSEF